MDKRIIEMGLGRPIVGVDLDGVLASFTGSYAYLLNKQVGNKLFDLYETRFGPTAWPTEWDWEHGVSKEQKRNVWEQISKSSSFWALLSAYDWTREAVNQLSLGRSKWDGLYFITSRTGINPQSQSQYWLNNQAMLAWNPSVLVVSKHEDKLPLLKSLHITHYIDDRWDTMKLLSESGLKTNLFLFDQPWNRQGEIEGVERISEFKEFMEALNG